MNRLSALLAVLFLATPVLAQKGLDKVVIPSAKIAVAPLKFQPGNTVTVDVSFRQGLAFAPIASLGCSGPTSTSSSPCDGDRSLAISLWQDTASGVRLPQSGGTSITFVPPSFYTLVQQSFPGIVIPTIEPNSFLTIELVFIDKWVKIDGHVGNSVVEVPRVLGMRRYKWSCRPVKAGGASKCSFVEVTT